LKIIKFADEYFLGFYNLLDEICREEKYLAFTEAPPLEAVKQFTEESILNGGIHYLLIDEENVIGWCDIVRSQIKGFMHSGRLGMGIKNEFRNKGLGKLLLEKVISEAKEKNFLRIELEVYVQNSNAINLYEKSGFIFEGKKINARYLNGSFEDIIFMAKLF